MLELLVILVVLALVGWGARGVLEGLGAPRWLYTVVLVVLLIIAVVVTANFFGVATPRLR